MHMAIKPTCTDQGRCCKCCCRHHVPADQPVQASPSGQPERHHWGRAHSSTPAALTTYTAQLGPLKPSRWRELTTTPYAAGSPCVHGTRTSTAANALHTAAAYAPHIAGCPPTIAKAGTASPGKTDTTATLCPTSLPL
jgi:hypothetical protein